jgi:hypothetical protein
LLIPLVAAALIAGLAVPAAAATSVAEYREARDKLHALSAEIDRRQVALDRSEARFEQLRVEVGRVVERIAEIRRASHGLLAEVATLRSHLVTLTRRLGEVVNTSYVNHPGGQLGMMLGVVVGAQSIAQLTDGVEFASRIASSTATVASEVLQTRTRLSERLGTLRALGAEKTGLLENLNTRRSRVHRLNVDRQRALRRLADTQRRMIEIVRRLHDEVAAQLFPLVGTAFQGGAHTSYGRWAVLFLQALEAPVCRSNEIAVVAWQLAEFTQAAWNPLATTKPMPGSWTFNSSGVRNFPSLESGLLANKLTLYDGWSSYRYGAIVTALRSCADPYSTARAIQASAWCHGCANGGYVVDKVGAVAANFEMYSAF